MSSSNQRPANRGFRSVLRGAISHYRQSPSLSAPEPSMRGRKRLWRWRLHRAGSTTVVCCRPCWIRFRVASFKSRATGPMTRGPVINRYSSGRLSPPSPPRRSARLSESVDPPAWRAMRDAPLREIRRLGRYEWRISSGCTRQSLAENAMSRFKTLFGPKLSARRFDNQRVEAIIKCAVLNRMSSRGMPESVRIR